MAEPVDPRDKDLTPQQRRFVAEYLIDFKALPAAIRAGYSPKCTDGGVRLMSTPHIAEEIARRCRYMQHKLEVEASDVHRGFAAIATHPYGPERGGPTWGERIQAWRELGKLFGLYTTKVHVTGQLTLEQLLLAADEKRGQSQPKLSIVA